MAFELRLKQFYPLIRFLGALGIALILYRFPLYYLEGALYDLRVRISPPPPALDIIQTVAIDSKTLQYYEGEPNTDDAVNLIEKISAENPHAVVYLSNPEAWVGSIHEKTLFAEKAAKITNFFFATEQIAPLSQNRHLRLNKPMDNLSLASAPITRDNVSFAGDKVTRRILLSYENQLFLQPILSNLYNKIVNPFDYRGSFEYEGSVFTYIRYSPTGTYTPLSFVDVKDGGFSKGTFTNKIVLIGTDHQLDTKYYALTPYSRHPMAMSRLEVQANMLSTLIQNNGVKQAPGWLDLLLTILMAYIAVLVVWRMRPVMGIALLLTQMLIFSILACSIFAVFAIWINMVHPLLALFVSYYFFIPYRLIAENKRSWEYFQKNRLLTQVEELKTNFLSMMSHDLKTPIARIQGMAELALTEKQKLSNPQKEALDTIIQSSEELGTFIGSILDLSRIESKEVKLQKSSKDVNTILREVVKKYEYNARAKNVLIIQELELLFSIRIDVDLIRQVFSNLVENAIKYSPENSTVVISSKEENGSIRIEIKDNGPGIPQDEVDNIFLKFYRSKAAKASPIKGSGLGLYLAKYFVELHEGTIAVESLPQVGTKFEVTLPLG